MPCLSARVAPASLRPDEPEEEGWDAPSVRLGRRLGSSRPRVIDDFSGSGLLSALRAIARLRNLDGPDDVAGAIPTAFEQAHQPFIEIGLLAALFPLVAVSAKGAVQAARAGYAQAYPDRVRDCLDQQQRLIDALRRGGPLGGGESEAALAPLVDLRARGVRRFEDRRAHRERGVFALLKHNLAARWHREPGNGALSESFNRAAADLLAARFARHRLQSDGGHGPRENAECDYQAHLLRRAEDDRRWAKRGRTAALFTGIGMPGMATGMGASASEAALTAGAQAARSAGSAAARTATEAAAQALGLAGGAVMMGAQLSQGVAGAMNGRLHAAQHRQLRQDRAALRAVAGELSTRVRALYEQDTRARLADSARSQACDALLSAGQGLMLGAGISNLTCPPAALALAVPGALLTVGASVGASLNETRAARYLGERAPEDLKAGMRLGNLGERLRDTPPDTVLQEMADRFAGHQDRLARTRLWHDILAVLKEEEGLRQPRSAAERHRRVIARNEGRDEAGALLSDGRERLHALREADHPRRWFEGTTTALQEKLSEALRQHPCSPAVGRLETFQRDVLFATASALARRDDAATRALFRDSAGRRRTDLRADHRFFHHVNHDPVARGLYLRGHNEVLLRHLTQADRFGRADSRDALTDLAHVTQAWRARHDAAMPDPVAPARAPDAAR